MTSLDSYITLGRSGLRVSPLTLGTMAFGEDWGRGADPQTSHRIMAAYLDAGGNAVDTANAYTNGHSEKIIGDFFARHPGRRDRVVLGTKFFCNLHPGDPNGGGAGRKSMIEQLEQSLRRLQTDYVDLLWLHSWDRGTPVEETMRALDDLVRAGKVRYLGFSDTPAWVAAEAQTLARLRGWSPIVAFQLEYSLLARTVEEAHLPMCQAHGMGVMPWSPLKKGLLATGAAASPTDRERQVVETVREIADEIGATPAAVAIAWVAGRDGVTSTLIGARTVEQFQSNLRALDTALGAGHLERLNAVSAPVPGFPAEYDGATAVVQYPGLTVDGVTHPVNPVLTASSTRY
jgi:aryl-alcohol dehydrogenase-like predicted oxidoreductase